MKLTRCNTCHANIHLDALVQDNSAKALLAAVAKLPKSLAINVIGYVALFRPEKSDLNNDRAARLINEVLALSDNEKALKIRLQIYHKDTKPLLKHYKSIKINGEQSIEKVSSEIMRVLGV